MFGSSLDLIVLSAWFCKVRINQRKDMCVDLMYVNGVSDPLPLKKGGAKRSGPGPLPF